MANPLATSLLVVAGADELSPNENVWGTGGWLEPTAREALDWLTLARLLDSRSLNPGDYSIEVRVRDRVSGQSLVQTAKFTVLP